MAKYELTINAWKTETSYKFNYETEERTDIKQSDIYEAITKYLQVKGFKASQVSVKAPKETKE